jgi:hypothetical protein
MRSELGSNARHVRPESTMRILYVFPHPDDEAFGPSRAIAAQRRQGHEVFLLTLTRGEATKFRHHFGWSLEMGRDVHFEVFRERHDPPLTDLLQGLEAIETAAR